MTLLRMLAFRPESAPAGSTGAPARSQSGKVSSTPAGGRTAVRDKPEARQSKPMVTSGEEIDTSGQAKAAVDRNTVNETDITTSADWASLIKAMHLKGVVRQVAVNCILLGIEGDTISLQLDPASKTLLTDTLKGSLKKRVSEHFGREMSLRIVLAEPLVETPARQVARQEQERIQQARDSLEADPNIQALKSTFGASIQEETVRPLDD
jgi:DNA polymerase-3 subunit gamma/tau